MSLEEVCGIQVKLREAERAVALLKNELKDATKRHMDRCCHDFEKVADNDCHKVGYLWVCRHCGLEDWCRGCK